MAQVINTNIASLNAQRNLNTSQSALSTALQRLSSGLRINGAKDDAAGLSIADRMSSQIRGLNQAIRNANDGISLSQTAEGALGEVGNILQRMRELSIQSANSTNSAADRRSLQSEVNQLIQEMDRIAQTTSFNGLNLLDGTFTSQQFQVGAQAYQSIGVSVGAATTQLTGVYQVKDSNATGIRSATQGQNGSTDATGVMNVATAATTAAGANLIAAQTLTITAPDGTTQTLSVGAATSATQIATDLNTKSGVSATATNVANVKLTSSEIQNGERASFSLDFNGNTQTVAFVRDSTAGSIDAQMKTAIDSAFSAYSDVSTAINSAGGVDVTSASGANMKVSDFKVQEKAEITLGTFANFAKDTGLQVTIGGAELTNAGAGWQANATLTSLDGLTSVTHKIGVSNSGPETFTASGFVAEAVGKTFIFDGTTYTVAAGGTASGAATATAFAAAMAGNANWTVTDNTTGTLTFTHKLGGLVTDAVAGDFTGTSATGLAERFTLSGFNGADAAGQTFAFDGLSVAIGAPGAATPTGVATATFNAITGSGSYAAWDWTVADSGAGTLTFTHKAVGVFTAPTGASFTGTLTDPTVITETQIGVAAHPTTVAVTVQGAAANVTVDGVDQNVAATAGSIGTKLAAAFTSTELGSLGLSTTVGDDTAGVISFKALGASGAAGVTFSSQGVTGSLLGAAGLATLTAATGATGSYVTTNNTTTGTAGSTLTNTTVNALTTKATNLINFAFSDGTLTDTVNIDLTGVNLKSANLVAAQLNTALANKQTVEVVGYTAGDSTITLRGKDYDKALTISSGSTTTAGAAGTANTTAANLVMTAANSDTSFNNTAATTTSGVYNLDTGTASYRIDPTNAAGTEAWESLNFNSASVAEALKKDGATGTAGNVFGVKTGTVAISLDPNYSIASSLAGSAAAGGIFNGSLLAFGANAGTTTAPDLTTASGLITVGNGNYVAAQTLTIKGEVTMLADVAKDSSAKAIAATVNQVADKTGVSAVARTTAQIGSLSKDGTVSMTLFGANSTGVSISAGVTTTNLANLVTALNQKAAQTGITATLDSGNASLTLTSSTGDDIKIQDFRHSGAVTSATAATAVATTINVTGELGTAVTLTNGGTTALAMQGDSTVIGGKVEFVSSKSFTVTSSLSGTAGSLFTGNASVEQGSLQQRIAFVDISSVTGAADAIAVIDGALAQINSIRADLGSLQNRFESTVSSLGATSNNVTAARSRIQDADFAAETAALTRGQILQQAGVAMLAQANALPNTVLALLK